MNTSVTLVHQFQPTPWSCVHTCLAMVMGVPAEQLIEEIGYPNGLNQMDALVVLERKGIMHAATMFGALWQGWQMVTVPSLNIRGGMHQILVHWEAGKYTVLDPSPKIRYKEDGSDLNGWSAVILVRPPLP